MPIFFKISWCLWNRNQMIYKNRNLIDQPNYLLLIESSQNTIKKYSLDMLKFTWKMAIKFMWLLNRNTVSILTVLKLVLWEVWVTNFQISFTTPPNVMLVYDQAHHTETCAWTEIQKLILKHSRYFLVSVSVSQFMPMSLYDGRGHFTCYYMIIVYHNCIINSQWQDLSK